MRLDPRLDAFRARTEEVGEVESSELRVRHPGLIDREHTRGHESADLIPPTTAGPSGEKVRD